MSVVLPHHVFEHVHVFFNETAHVGLHGVAIKTNHVCQGFFGEQRRTTGLFLQNDLQQNAAREVLAVFGVHHLDGHPINHPLFDVCQRDVRRRCAVVQTSVGVLLDHPR